MDRSEISAAFNSASFQFPNNPIAMKPHKSLMQANNVDEPASPSIRQTQRRQNQIATPKQSAVVLASDSFPARQNAFDALHLLDSEGTIHFRNPVVVA